jgi:hypothetical protein
VKPRIKQTVNIRSAAVDKCKYTQTIVEDECQKQTPKILSHSTQAAIASSEEGDEGSASFSIDK